MSLKSIFIKISNFFDFINKIAGYICGILVTLMTLNVFFVVMLRYVFGISFMGIIIFAIAFALMVKISPFSVKKEIEEDQNTSLGIIYGSVFIALAIIISAAVS